MLLVYTKNSLFLSEMRETKTQHAQQLDDTPTEHLTTLAVATYVGTFM